MIEIPSSSPAFTDSRVKLLRITTEPYSLYVLLRGQMNFMGAKGIKVFMASSYSDEVPALQQNENARHYTVPLSRRFTPLYDLYSLYKMILLIRRLRPDIVHTHSPKAGTIGMIAAYLCQVPLKIHTIAGLPLMETKGWMKKLLLLVEKMTYAAADYILPNSVEMKKIVLAEKLVKRTDKLQIIGHGSSNGINLSFYNRAAVPPDHLSKLKAEYQLMPGDIVFAYVGRLTASKGLNELVEAFMNLCATHQNLKLFLIGRPEAVDPLKKEVLQTIESVPQIIATGHQHDIRPFLAAADIFVFPSYREGFPQALMQACAMELPCIATNINGCNEIISDGVNGLLIQPKNVQQIVDACKKLLIDENLRQQFASNARALLEQNFEQQRVWHNLYNFYTTH